MTRVGTLLLCEIGGHGRRTSKALPFFEANPPVFSTTKPAAASCNLYATLTLLPYLAASGELKIQTDAKTLRQGIAKASGIAPDILVAVPKHPIPEKDARRRNRPFLGKRPQRRAVRAAYDLKNIMTRRWPFTRQGLDQAVLDAFDILPRTQPELVGRRDVSGPRAQPRRRSQSRPSSASIPSLDDGLL